MKTYRNYLLEDYIETQKKNKRLVECLNDLLDDLDSNGGPEVCGLTQKEWNKRIKKARKTLLTAEREMNEGH